MPAAELRPLGSRDLEVLESWFEASPIEHCYLKSQLERTGTQGFLALGRPMRAGALVRPARLLVPFGETVAGAGLGVALRGLQPGLRYVVGRCDLVDALWAEMGPSYPTPEWRRGNTLYELTAPTLLPDRAPLAGRLRPPVATDMEWLVLASAVMDREDRGVDPLEEDPVGLERYVNWLISEQLVYLWEEEGRPIFKAQAACVNHLGALIEGVFTMPDSRGRGVAGSAMRALARELLRRTSRLGLYVNQENTAAVRLYESVGFRPVGEYRSILFHVPSP